MRGRQALWAALACVAAIGAAGASSGSAQSDREYPRGLAASPWTCTRGFRMRGLIHPGNGGAARATETLLLAPPLAAATVQMCAGRQACSCWSSRRAC